MATESKTKVSAQVQKNQQRKTKPQGAKSPKAEVRKVQLLTVDAEQDGQRLDNFLIRRLRGVPRSRVYRLIRRGEVRVNSRRSKPEQKLATGDKVRVPPYSGPDAPSPGKPTAGLTRLLTDAVFYEEEGFFALNKPAGLAVHGGSNIRLGVIEALRQIRPEWQQAELVHRLDRDTSGILLIAKTASALKALQAQFKARTVTKSYLALVHGHWNKATKEITVPLKKGELSGGERIVRPDPNGKPALTRFKVQKHLPQATLLEAQPETGRTHQIRVHCQQAGHPILGDPKYTLPQQPITPPQTTPQQGSPPQAKHLCLHAATLSFTPPTGKGQLKLEAQPAPHFTTLLKTLE